MKKLNKKGFTLIELLAVIVILAIIVVVTVPTILNSIDDARASSLHSLAKEVANWYDTSYGQDMIASAGNKILGDVHLDHSSQTTAWVCLTDINGSTEDGEPNLATIYGLSATDLNLATTGVPTGTTASSATCSAIRLNGGRAEVVLVGTESGKFGKRYAFSSQDSSKDY